MAQPKDTQDAGPIDFHEVVRAVVRPAYETTDKLFFNGWNNFQQTQPFGEVVSMPRGALEQLKKAIHCNCGPNMTPGPKQGHPQFTFNPKFMVELVV